MCDLELVAALIVSVIPVSVASFIILERMKSKKEREIKEKYK